jgi:phenylpyruvate tautomerase PptA (4-oxalocrotonate tautomerase family)
MTARHTTIDEHSQKVANNYCCKKCDYYTSKKTDYAKHCLTAKHKMITNGNIKKEIHFSCACGKEYTNRHNLCRHKKTCSLTSCNNESVPCNNESVPCNNESVPSNLTTTLIMEIIKENKEIKNLLFEQQKENNLLMNKMLENTLSINAVNNTNNTINNNNNTINNNTQFNIQLFLNENCKNAVNFSDFIDNIQVTDDDLENNAKMGFVEGVTKIIMDNLRLLDLTNRPIHCTDAKRETIYVKVEEQWDKDNSIKVIQKGIQDITCKNMQQLVDWRENNPSYADDMDSELGEKSIVMQQNSMAGTKREEYYPKIIKNIAKETVISNKSGLIKK